MGALVVVEAMIVLAVGSIEDDGSIVVLNGEEVDPAVLIVVVLVVVGLGVVVILSLQKSLQRSGATSFTINSSVANFAMSG